MSSRCKNLQNLPNISNINITKMASIFYDWVKLEHLSYISKWITNNAINFYGIFGGCKSLLNLPDICK